MGPEVSKWPEKVPDLPPWPPLPPCNQGSRATSAERTPSQFGPTEPLQKPLFCHPAPPTLQYYAPEGRGKALFLEADRPGYCLGRSPPAPRPPHSHGVGLGPARWGCLCSAETGHPQAPLSPLIRAEPTTRGPDGLTVPRFTARHGRPQVQTSPPAFLQPVHRTHPDSCKDPGSCCHSR